MSVDTKAFMKQGINILELKKYLEENFKEVVLHEEGRGNWCCYVLSFVDGEDKRILFASVCYDDEDNYYPTSIIPKKSIVLSFGCWGNSVEILKGILEHFGGGFLLPSDAGFDGTGWQLVSPIEGCFEGLTELEVNVYKLLLKDKVGLSNDDMIIFDFIVNNLDEIKKL